MIHFKALYDQELVSQLKMESFNCFFYLKVFYGYIAAETV